MIVLLHYMLNVCDFCALKTNSQFTMLAVFTHRAAVQLLPSVLFLYGMQPNTGNREQRVHASPNTLSGHTALHIIATYRTPSLGIRCSRIACELLGN